MEKTKHKKTFIQFPQNFIWGIGVSSHQHDGNNIYSDWWQWEQLAGKIKHGEKSGEAVNHWDFLESDLDRVKALGLEYYRFNFEWARLEPQMGHWDAHVIKYYQRKIELIEKKGLKPFISLHHMTLPKWFVDIGGFANADAQDQFRRYSKLCVEELAPNCLYWTSSVDWSAHIWAGYGSDKLPPGKKDLSLVPSQLEGFLNCHAIAYDTLHRYGPKNIKVGLVNFIQIFDYAFDLLAINKSVAKNMSKHFNWIALDSIKKGKLEIKIPFALKYSKKMPQIQNKIDFIGINYYGRSIIDLKWWKGGIEKQLEQMITENPISRNTSDMGWEIYPKGMYRTLMKCHEDYPWPIFITEHGLADADDSRRVFYMKSYLREAKRAMDHGADVRACFHWSLTDNFEWLEGFGPKFGFFSVDRKTMKRYPRPSAIELKKLTLKGGFEWPLEERPKSKKKKALKHSAHSF